MDRSSLILRPRVGRFGGYTVFASSGAAQAIAEDVLFGVAGSVAVAANSISAASSVGSPAIGQKHALAAVSIASSTTVAAPSIAQRHALVANGLSAASSVGSPSISSTITYSISASGIVAASFVGAAVVSSAGSTAASEDADSGAAWADWAKARSRKAKRKPDDHQAWLRDVEQRVAKLLSPPIPARRQPAQKAIVAPMVAIQQPHEIDWVERWETAFPVPVVATKKVAWPPAPKPKTNVKAIASSVKEQVAARRRTQVIAAAKRARRQMAIMRLRQRVDVKRRVRIAEIAMLLQSSRKRA